MTSYKINIPGDEALLFSLPDDPLAKGFDFSVFSGIGKTVFLYPRADETFGVTSFMKKGGIFDGYTDVLAAAIHLKKNRGLPLDELEFTADFGRASVFFPKKHILSLSVPRLKIGLENNEGVFSGCNISWQDCYAEGLMIRITECKDTAGVSADALRSLAAAKGEIPDFVVAYSKTNGEIKIKALTEHNKNATRGTGMLFLLLSYFIRLGDAESILYDGFNISFRNKGVREIIIEISI